MGWNTAILFLNDAIGEIEGDPKQVVKNISAMMEGMSHHSGDIMQPGKSLAVGNHGNPMTLLSRDHADVTNLVAIGGNHGTTLYSGHNGGRHYEKDDQIKLLKQAAEALGYRLSKIPE